MAAKNCADPSSGATLIDHLPDDCLLHIFQYLPHADRVRIERVCPRWRCLALQSWRAFKCLNILRESWGLYPEGKEHKVRPLDDKALLSVVKRCGQFLRVLDVCDDYGSDTLKLQFSLFDLEEALLHCRRLQKIRIDFTHLTHESSEFQWFLIMLAGWAQKLTSLEIRSCYLWNVHFYDRQLSTVFKINSKLRHFLMRDVRINGDCLEELDVEHLETLCLNNCWVDNIESSRRFLSRLKSLKIFEWDYSTHATSTTLNKSIMRLLSLGCNNLEKISFSFKYRDKEPDDHLPLLLSQNRNLRSIKLKRAIVSEDFFTALNPEVIEEIHLGPGCRVVTTWNPFVRDFLCKCSTLRSLSLDFSQFINGLGHPMHLPPCLSLRELHLSYFLKCNFLLDRTFKNLETFILGYDDPMDDQYLEVICKRFPGLKKLQIWNINTVTDEGLRHLNSLSLLEEVCVGGCEVTGRTLGPMPGLKKIRLKDCSKLEVASVIQLLENSPNLTYLAVPWSSKFDKDGQQKALELLNTAVRITSTRNNDRVLKLPLREFELVLDKICGKSRYLQLT